MFSNVNFVICLMVGLVFVKTGTAIDCYVCRSCETVGPDDVQTCPGSEGITDEPEITTSFDGLLLSDEAPLRKSAVNVPWLEEADADTVKGESFIIDDSELPGGDRIPHRSLMQATATDDARCIVTVFQENGVTDVIRGCSTASDDPNLRCSEAITGSGNFSGPMIFCHLCAEDLCNSGTKAAVGTVLILLGVISNFILFQSY